RVTRALIPADAPSAEIDRLVRSHMQANQPLYTLNLRVLEALKPDFIVTQALCGVCAVSEHEVQSTARILPGRPYVINLEPRTLYEVFLAIRQVAEAVGVPQKADQVIAALVARVEAVAERSALVKHRPRVALIEWLDPPFSSGHWGPELVRLAGGIDLLGKEGQPSRTLNWVEICKSAPEVVFIACCGFSIERTLEDVQKLSSIPGWQEIPAVRSGRVYVTDGSQYFSRPGPRLVDSLEMLAYALHPTVHRLPPGLPGPAKLALTKRANYPGKNREHLGNDL
ncbi:MAG: ABC transporter substrate-binding protein, partial [bacterium JZ-2024 1]